MTDPAAANCTQGPVPIETAAEQEDRPGYFEDGVRRIDYILVWKEDLDHDDDDAAADESPVPLDPANVVGEMSLEEKFRIVFQENLQDCGVETEETVTCTHKMKIHFVKLHVTWEAMCYYAQYLRLRAPLKVLTKSRQILPWHARNPMLQTVPNQPRCFYTCAFDATKAHKFLGFENQETYFTPNQRHLVAYEILGTRVFGEQERCEIGIDQLIRIGVYDCAFPLHEGSKKLPKGFSRAAAAAEIDGAQHLSPRQVLRAYWASWSVWYKYQPLDHVREYFGEKIAFYFALLGHCTTWLLPLAIVGILTIVVSFIQLRFDSTVSEICDSGDSFVMCPIHCSQADCAVFPLSALCPRVKGSKMFDQPVLVAYAVFVSVWAAVFLEFWRRRSAQLNHRWGVASFQSEDRPRPAYAIHCTEFQEDRITGQLEPYLPRPRRLLRICASALCVIVLMILITVVPAVLNSVVLFLPMSPNLSLYFRIAIFMFSITVCRKICPKISHRLTNWELHRTSWQFENHYLTKITAIDIWLWSEGLIVTFFETAMPQLVTLTGGTNIVCQAIGSCMYPLTFIMVGTLCYMLSHGIASSLIMRVRRVRRRCKRSLARLTGTPWESDYGLLSHTDLAIWHRGVLVHFAFVSLFATLSPLTPAICLIWYATRIRTCARRLVLSTRRPVPERAQGIGVCLPLLQAISMVSVLTNALFLAFISEFVPKVLYQFEVSDDLHGFVNFSLAHAVLNRTGPVCRYRAFRDPAGNYTEFHWKLLTARLAFFLVFVHFVIICVGLVSTLTSRVPKSVRLETSRERRLAALALIDAAAQPEQKASRQ